MKRCLKVGVIGVGSMGANHVRVYANRNDIDLRAIVEPNHTLGTAVAQRFNTRLFSDLDEFLCKSDIDLVSIAVPTRFHKEVAEKCLRAGINCLVEKPIALNVDEAVFLSNLSKDLKLKLLVGHIERYNPAIQALKKKILEGEAGRIYRIEVERSGPFPGRITDTGVVIDLAVHDLDIVSMIMDGSYPIRVYAETQQLLHEKYEDAVYALLNYKDGVIASLNVNWTSPVKRRFLRIFGSRGMFQVNYITQELRFFENAFQVDAVQPWENRGIQEGNEIKYSIGFKEPLASEIDYMIRVVGEDLDITKELQDSISALRLARLIVSSGEKRELITLGHLNDV